MLCEIVEVLTSSNVVMGLQASTMDLRRSAVPSSSLILISSSDIDFNTPIALARIVLKLWTN